MLSRFDLLSISDEVVVAQIEAIKRRIPVLYAVLMVNTIAMAVTHHGYVNDFLSVYAPGSFCCFMAVRGYIWLKLRDKKVQPDQARKMLKQTTILAGLFALLMLIWSGILYYQTYHLQTGHGGITLRGHAVLYVGMTVISCILLLMHARMSATVVTLIVMVPFCSALLMAGTLVERAVALNLILVSVAMLHVLAVYGREFRELIRSRSDLEKVSAYQTHLANTDNLTGLANRRQFFARLDTFIAEHRLFALIMIDLDGFKQVNDLHGHAVGDAVLVRISARMRDTVTGDHCLARIGGDEFAVMHEQIDPEALVAISETLIAVCSQPVEVEGLIIKIGASVGISIMAGPRDGEARYNLLEQADFALSFVKQNGKGQVELFRAEHEHSIRRRGEIEQALRNADLGSEIRLVFQPVVRTGSLGVIGFEALARWNSPVLGAVPPAEFIPVAERCGMIQALTLTVLDKALGQARAWPSDVRLKINLSARDIDSPVQMLKIGAALRRSGVDASRLTFELTETAFGEDLSKIMDAVTLIRALGASLAIDDFGTGYSNLRYVQHLHPDLIKIDRSFVSRLDDEMSSASIVKTIIELCRNIGARSLAEGVETATQAETLKELGVDEMQGYLFGRPQEADTISILRQDVVA